ncbi:MAG: hypothetical protein VZR06_08720 [Butyrivibrio sp.]|nr:hypothetical protein [Butyrivibrio sp.]
MKKSFLFMILWCPVLFVGCSESEEKNNAISGSELSSLAELSSGAGDSIEDKANAFEESSEEIEDDSMSLESGDDQIDALIKENVIISDSEKLEYTGWNESNEIFRVAIQRAEHSDSDYDHVKDYFFVKHDPDAVSWFAVDYPDGDDIHADRHVEAACDFTYEYVDVTFDGNKDIIIFLGYQGAHGSIKNCAYVYDNGDYKYKKSFEDIPNYSINSDEKVIEGTCNLNNYEIANSKYEYNDGEFNKIEETVEDLSL